MGLGLDERSKITMAQGENSPCPPTVERRLKMAKSFLSKRSPEGIAAMEHTIDALRRSASLILWISA